MDLDRLNKLVAQWGNLVAAIGALVAAVAICTPLTTLNPWAAWSGCELMFVLNAVALVGVIVGS